MELNKKVVEKREKYYYNFFYEFNKLVFILE